MFVLAGFVFVYWFFIDVRCCQKAILRRKRRVGVDPFSFRLREPLRISDWRRRLVCVWTVFIWACVCLDVKSHTYTAKYKEVALQPAHAYETEWRARPGHCCPDAPMKAGRRSSADLWRRFIFMTWSRYTGWQLANATPRRGAASTPRSSVHVAEHGFILYYI